MRKKFIVLFVLAAVLLALVSVKFDVSIVQLAWGCAILSFFVAVAIYAYYEG